MMGRILFLSVAAFLALRYIQTSNKKQQKLLDEQNRKSLPPAAEPPVVEPSKPS